MLPAMVAIVPELLSPLFRSPPFKIRPGLPPTPGKLRVVGGVPLVRSSVLVFNVNELPGNVTAPLTAGDRTRVLFTPLAMPMPLKTSAQGLLAFAATVAPVPLVCQMTAVQSAPCAWTFVVVRITGRLGVAFTWAELAVSPPKFGTKPVAVSAYKGALRELLNVPSKLPLA